MTKLKRFISCRMIINGFTLIELLVSITIISVLFGVVLINSNALRSTSNDARKKADLAQIQSALQNYYADLSYYPKSGTGGLNLHTATPNTSLDSTVGIASPAPSPLPSLKIYLKTIPNDSSAPYCYVPVKSAITDISGTITACDNSITNRCNYYYLSTSLSNPSPDATPLPTSVSCGSTNNNYVVNP